MNENNIKRQGKVWLFTCYAQAGVLSDDFESYWSTMSWGTYGGGQVELAPNPSPDNPNPLHFQGFVYWPTNQRKKAVLEKCIVDPSICRHPHFICADGELEHQEAYTSKEETRAGTKVIRWGERPVRKGRGHRSDLEEATELIRTTTGDSKKRMREVAFNLPSVYVRYSRGLRELAEELCAAEVSVKAPAEEELFPWQRELKDKLMLPPNDRTINYVYDPVGENGKSSLIRFFLKNYPDETVILDGKVADMSYGYTGQKYVFIDIPRSGPDAIGNQPNWTPNHLYHFAEKLKNGFFFSGKFNSGVKVFNIPHVTFMSNSPPIVGLWTQDRLNLIQISQPLAPLFNFPNNV